MVLFAAHKIVSEYAERIYAYMEKAQRYVHKTEDITFRSFDNLLY